LHPVAASLLDPQADKNGALTVGQPSRILPGDMRFGALVRQQVLANGETSPELSVARPKTDAECSPTAAHPPENAGISVRPAMGNPLSQARSAEGSSSAPEAGDISESATPSPGIGEGFVRSAVAEPQVIATAIQPSTAAGDEVDPLAAGSCDDARPAREFDAGLVTVDNTISPPPSRSTTASGRPVHGDSEWEAPAGTKFFLSHPTHSSGFVASGVGAASSFSPLKSTSPAAANPAAVSEKTVSGGGGDSEPALATPHMDSPADSAVVPAWKESAQNLSAGQAASPGKPVVAPGDGKRSPLNPSSIPGALLEKPALALGAGKKYREDSPTAHAVSARFHAVPAQPATSAEPTGVADRSVSFSAVTAAPVAVAGIAQGHSVSPSNIQQPPVPNLNTSAKASHPATGRQRESGTQQVANFADMPSGSGPSAAQHFTSRSIAITPAIKTGMPDQPNGAVNKKLDHMGSQVATADSIVHAPANPRFELDQSMGPVSIAGTHATSAMAATRAPAASMDVPHAATGAAFERMDSAATPQVIESSTRRLAVGVRNADLGWVEIRTSNAAGQVSATLATSSAESHSVVSAQLPSMREYLAGQQVRVDSLASENFSMSSGHQEASSGDQPREDGGTGGMKVPEPVIPARTSVADADTESLSYINVRV
jgi:hypothetical protein